MSKADAFTQALKQARLAEAAQLEAVVALRDAGALRLLALRDLLRRDLEGHPQALALFDLNVQDGGRPKLWLDLISFIEMQPDPKTYRLVQDGPQGRESLFETQDVAAMQARALQHLAHRLLAHDKAAAVVRRSPSEAARSYGLGEVVYVWITGLLFGVLAFIAWALAQGIVKF